MSPASEPREITRTRLATRREDVIALSHSLHAEPELAFEEHKSARKIADFLEGSGFDVARGICDLPTAFSGTYGSGDLVIGITAEYDALPGIGHACGHNVNGAAAVAAALALAPVADDLGITVKLLGTPAEEYGGGKVYMLDRGAFDDIAAAMMVHAGPGDGVDFSSQAISSWKVSYTGRAAHAAAMPHKGVNAADAMMIAQVAIGAHRQQMIPGGVVHGIVTCGGEAPNVIPGQVTADYDCRADSADDLRELKDRIRACFEAGALATGAALELADSGRDYADLRQDAEFSQAYRQAAEDLGRTFPVLDSGLRGGSTDMGNISHVMPTIHPAIGYDCGDTIMHNPEFTRFGTTPGADKAVLDGGLAMAWTAITLATTDTIRQRLLAAVADRPARAEHRVQAG
ncbi:M20 family metallopeptidase [Streptomyces poriferorum]|uniref:Peptidase M20 domain-containing protein 2 n=1 Tax=Streptomyces poriferorum TaxID=2798799 RepID=A0ABY9IPI0_9ACTN|nr:MULTISPECIES: M20 family metallopeptidase [unclassified Streptomyces]MDP5313769.1 M20 family metallopeptidase [Streptomyces sp. Alt4]WLQ57275.1 M20 family metallopeptidase [Streptomyces sp. Alt2]